MEIFFVLFRDGIHFESGEYGYYRYSSFSATNSSACNSSSTSSSKNPHDSGSDYSDYLRPARVSVENCIVACRNWSSFYGREEDPVAPSVSSPTISPPSDLPSTGTSYSDIVRSIGGRGVAAVSETNSSTTCDDISEWSGQAIARPADDLLSFLVQLNRTSLPERLESSGDIVAEFEQLLRTFSGCVSPEPVTEVDLISDSPSSGAIGRTSSLGLLDGGFAGAQGWQTVSSETQHSLSYADVVSRDARLSVTDVNRGYAGSSVDTPCIGN